MKKGYTILMWTSIVGGALGITYLIGSAIRINKLKKDAEKKTDDPNVLNTVVTAPAQVGEFPLSEANYGFKSDKITVLQSKLNDAYNTGLVTDGVWGRKTHTAVKEKLNKQSIVDNADYKKVIDGLTALTLQTAKAVYAANDTYLYSEPKASTQIGKKIPKGSYIGKEVKKAAAFETFTKVSYKGGYFDQIGYVLTKDIRY
ncbi:MAG: hypothetical protein WCT77_00275 [Bacteroidota bacterium]